MIRRPLFVVLLATCAAAQSFEWSRDFALPGAATTVNAASLVATATFDDGTGPALYVAGQLHAAGHVGVSTIAKWNGAAWTSMPSTLTYAPSPSAARVAVLAVYDDGAGPALYAAGVFDSIDGVPAKCIARWNGANWQALGQGMNGSLVALKQLDLGAGPVLCVGSQNHATINGGTATSFATWDGASWSLVGASVDGKVHDFAIFDDGNGPKLYLAGQSLAFPNVAQGSSVARFDGNAWSNVGGAVEGSVEALTVFDDGSGAALFAGGSFLNLGATPVNYLGKWDGTNWLDVGGGVAGAAYPEVETLRVHDDGSGPALFVGGFFGTAGNVAVNNLARWNGTSFTALGAAAGVSFAYATQTNYAHASALAEYDAGNGPELFVAGSFSRAGNEVAASIASWDGSQWSALADPGLELGAERPVSVLATYDVGAGPRLLAAGEFDAVGTLPSEGLASFDGASWSSFGLGAQRDVLAAKSFDDGSGEALYIGGSFDSVDGQPALRLAKWNGASWTGLISSITPSGSSVYAIGEYDDGLGAGPQLYIGGTFKQLGSVTAYRVARWDGSAWHAVGNLGASQAVATFAVHDDGTGSKLYAGGSFISMDGVSVFGVARWNGVAWEAVGNGFDSAVSQLAVFDDGSGPQLYAAGSFTQAPPIAARGLARWDGVAWQAVGNGLGAGFGTIESLAVFDAGAGAGLYVGGNFNTIDGLPIANLARWSGANWSSVGALDGSVLALQAFDDGTGLGAALYVGGTFATVDGRATGGLAKLERSCGAVTYCTSGTTSSGCAPSISASGTPSASASSGFTISVASVEGQRQGHIFYGLSGPHAAPWGASSHFLCVKAPTQRTPTQTSGGNAGACDGAMALDWNAYVATHPGALGTPFSVGTQVWAQLYFRDPAGPKTTALSNALTFAVCP